MINWPYLSTFRVTHTPNFDSSETPEKINVQNVFAIEQFVAWILLIQKLKVKLNEEVRCQVWLMTYHIGLYRNGVLTVQHIKRLEFRLCHMWHCSWIMAVRVGHCRKSTQMNFKSNECVEISVGKYARHVHRIVSHSFIENVLDKAVFYVHEITFSIQSNGFLCNRPLFYSLSFKVYHSTTSI